MGDFIKIESNIEELSRSIAEYVTVSRKNVDDALKKQGAKLAFNLRRELRTLAPARGSIRAQLEARLASHPRQPVFVRPSIIKRIYEKYGVSQTLGSRTTVMGKGLKGTRKRGGRQLNVWALAVQAEINARESARGFLSVSAIFPGIKVSLDSPIHAVSRWGALLAIAAFSKNAQGSSSIEFDWGQFNRMAAEAGESINKPRALAAVNRALVGTIEDIQEYIDRKLGEAWSGR